MDKSFAKEFIETNIAKKLTEKPSIGKGIGVPVAIELTGDGGGRWVIDFTTEPATVSNDGSARAETTIKMEAEIFEKLVNGELNAQAAFLSGKVKVEGNLGAAIKLGQLLS